MANGPGDPRLKPLRARLLQLWCVAPRDEKAMAEVYGQIREVMRDMGHDITISKAAVAQERRKNRVQ